MKNKSDLMFERARVRARSWARLGAAFPRTRFQMPVNVNGNVPVPGPDSSPTQANAGHESRQTDTTDLDRNVWPSSGPRPSRERANMIRERCRFRPRCIRFRCDVTTGALSLIRFPPGLFHFAALPRENSIRVVSQQYREDNRRAVRREADRSGDRATTEVRGQIVMKSLN